MLKAMCRMPPCMNIEVSTVAHQGESRGARRAALLAGERLGLPVLGRSLADDLGPRRCPASTTVPTAQSSPGWVSR